MDSLNFTRDTLFFELSRGRELEFHIEENKYFIGPQSESTFYIWDEQLQKILCVGSMDKLFSFTFREGVTLNDNIECFFFDYLL